MSRLRRDHLAHLLLRRLVGLRCEIERPANRVESRAEFVRDVGRAGHGPRQLQHLPVERDLLLHRCRIGVAERIEDDVELDRPGDLRHLAAITLEERRFVLPGRDERAGAARPRVVVLVGLRVAVRCRQRRGRVAQVPRHAMRPFGRRRRTRCAPRSPRRRRRRGTPSALPLPLRAAAPSGVGYGTGWPFFSAAFSASLRFCFRVLRPSFR